MNPRGPRKLDSTITWSVHLADTLLRFTRKGTAQGLRILVDLAK